MPATQFRIQQALFQIGPQPALVGAGASARRETSRVAPQKPGRRTARFLFEQVAETRNIGAVGSATISGTVEHSIELCRNARPVVVKRYVFPQYPTVVAKSIWEPVGGRIKQNQVGVERGCIQENNAGIKLLHLFSLSINYAHTYRSFFCFVVNNGMYHRVRPEGHFARPHGPGQRTRIAAEITTIRTTALTNGAVLTLRPALLQMYGFGLGDVGRAAHNHVPVGIFGRYFFLKMRLHTVPFVGRQKLAVGQARESVFIARNAGEFLHVAIPGGQISIANGPVNSESVTGRAVEIEVAPPLRLPRPHQRFTANLIAPNPVEWFFLHIRVFGIFHKKLFGAFIKRIALADNRVGLAHLPSELAPVFKFPGLLHGGGVVGHVLHVAPAFQHECFEALAG